MHARLHNHPVSIALEGDNVGPFRPLQDELREFEKLRIRQALRAADGNKTRAAELLRIPIRTMFNKVQQLESLVGRKPK